MKKTIILNKAFEGSWNNESGHISHEIIDFIKTDTGELYVYNTPLGQCPKNIRVKGDESEFKGDVKDYKEVQYLLLTGPANGKGREQSFKINYCIELKRRLHNLSSAKNINCQEKLEKNFNVIKRICDENNIVYGGKKLYEIHPKDRSLLVTFQTKKIYKATNDIIVSGLEYNYQRNKGYIDSENITGKNNDYYILNEIIEEKIKNRALAEIKDLKNINATKNNVDNYDNKSFLDLILKTESEECYTNILFSILSYDNLINKFCEKFAQGQKIDDTEKFNVSREQGIVGGRMDVCADNGKQKIVIENKVYSGLNGTKKDDPTQLTTYYNWATKDRNIEPLCFITAPDYRLEEIEKEIEKEDNTMKSKYILVGFSKIADFIKENMSILNDNNTRYEYAKYVNDFPLIFKQLGYTDKQEYYNSLFLKAINRIED